MSREKYTPGRKIPRYIYRYQGEKKKKGDRNVCMWVTAVYNKVVDDILMIKVTFEQFGKRPQG